MVTAFNCSSPFYFESAEERGNRPGQLNGPNGSESIDYAAMAKLLLPFKGFVFRFKR
jgi:hypothetical protein